MGGVLPLLLFLLSACASGEDILKERKELAETIAKRGDMTPVRLTTGCFTLQGYQRITAPESKHAIVYIEGDGQAYKTPSRPAINATPSDPVALRMAAQDNHANVIYLARPCHYTREWNPQGTCPQKFWTSHRFSREVIESYMAALDTLKKRHGLARYHLAGYSGGGAVTALLAARRDDIASLRTIAGNLDHDRVNAHHGVDPMPDSLNPADYAHELGDIPQIHYSGADDTVVPPKIAKGFIARLPKPACARLKVIDGADHHNLAQYWPELADAQCRNTNRNEN